MRLTVGWNTGAVITTVGAFSAAAVGGYIGAVTPRWPWWVLAVLALLWGLSISVPQVLALSESQRELGKRVDDLIERAAMQSEIREALIEVAGQLAEIRQELRRVTAR
ncbi:MAG: hypothetical protein M3P93_02710 [Actinomycetota bacterium]|jgi:MFS family permease|nr:hypothetical protein [Actinomycetota bacterium]